MGPHSPAGDSGSDPAERRLLERRGRVPERLHGDSRGSKVTKIRLPSHERRGRQTGRDGRHRENSKVHSGEAGETSEAR